MLKNIVFLSLLLAVSVLQAQDIITFASAALIPDELFHYYIGDIPPETRNNPTRMLSEFAFEKAEEISGELLDQADVYWKYYLLPDRKRLLEEIKEIEFSIPVIAIENYETPMSIWYRGQLLDPEIHGTEQRLEYFFYDLGIYTEGEPVFFRIEANPYAGEEIYLTDISLLEKAESRLPFFYVRRELPVTLFSFFTLLVAVGMLSVFIAKLPSSDLFLLWFGLFALAYTIYSVFESHTANLLFPIPPILDFYVPLLAQDIMPIFLLLFYLSFSIKAWKPVFLGLITLQIVVLIVRVIVMINGFYSEWSNLLSLATPILFFIVAITHLILKQRYNPYAPLFLLAFTALGFGYLLQLSGELFDNFGDMPIFMGSILFFLILSYLPIFSYFRQQAHITSQNVAFARFVPREFLSILNREDITEVTLGDQIEREFTILFSDIRSFTTISEKMTPDENFRFINSYLAAIAPVIRKNRGFVDKYIGDAVMALFPGEPADAVRCAKQMLEQLKQHNEINIMNGDPEIRIGIGIHTGNTMLGIVGEAERYQGTVISDAVNIASRLESLTKKSNCPLLISSDTAGRLPAAIAVYKVGTVTVRGKTQSIKVFTLNDYRTNGISLPE